MGTEKVSTRASPRISTDLHGQDGKGGDHEPETGGATAFGVGAFRARSAPVDRSDAHGLARNRDPRPRGLRPGVGARRPAGVRQVENDWIPTLAAQGLLAVLDFQHLPNFRHVGPEFRDLAVDPGNTHSVPFRYGTTGLLVRRDLVRRPVTRWADLWAEGFTGRVGFREMREVVGLTALSLGYPLDTEDPAHLDAVVGRLIALKPKMVPVQVEEDQAVARLLSGEIAVLVGWSGDYWQAAERPIDFLLRPEVSAAVVNSKAYPTTSQAALRRAP